MEIKKDVKEVKLAIIGTAGRKYKLRKKNFQTMYSIACEKVKDLKQKNLTIHAISGGSAWTGHISVKLYIEKKIDRLTLHLPCKWDGKQCKFKETLDPKCTGKSANKYFKQFSDQMGRNMLEDIDIVIENKQSNIHIWDGFFKRNDKIAEECDMMICFGIKGTVRPTSGGSLYTWNKCTLGEDYKFYHNIIKLSDKFLKMRPLTFYL